MKIIGMAIMPIALCASFASCGGDEYEDDENVGRTTIPMDKKDNDAKDNVGDNTTSIGEKDNDAKDNVGDNVVGTGKKLVSIVNADGSDYYILRDLTYTYGADGLLAVVPNYNNYYWEDSQVTIADIRGSGDEVYTLYNDKITQCKMYKTNYKLAYDNNHLTYAQAPSIYYKKWVWENDNITEYYENGKLCRTFEYYTDKVNKHYTYIDTYLLAIFTGHYEGSYILISAYPNLIGTSNKNLLKKVTFLNSNYSYELAYTLDSDGYPTTIVLTKTTTDSSESTETTTYTYLVTWE